MFMLLWNNKTVEIFVFLCWFVYGGTPMSGRNGVSNQLLVGPKGRSNHSCGWTLTHIQSTFNQIDQYCFYVLRVTWAHIISCTFQRPRCQNRANFASCEQKYQVTAPSNQTDCVNFRTNTLFCLATKWFWMFMISIHVHVTNGNKM